MKKIFCLVSTLVIVLVLSTCSSNDETSKPEDAVETQITAANVPTADDLHLLINQYEIDGNYQAVYEISLDLIKQTPDDADVYIAAANALLEISRASEAEMDRIIALGVENTGEDAKIIADWAKENAPDTTIEMPFSADTTSEQFNIEGITTGNMTNAAKYRNDWWQGGLLTWQGDWIYLARPDEDFAIYKLRADGSGYQRLGEVSGSSLNVVGEWLYYLSIQDSCPCKMRTDGSMNTKIIDEECSFLSVSGEWMYYGGDRLYKMRTDGSEKTGLTEELTIFPCVSGDWVYYCIKSETGGLWRVSVDGGDPQQVAQGFIQTYCVADDWVYYVDQRNWSNLWRARTDGTDAEVILPFDFRITTINVADNVLYMSINVTNEEQDGFIAGAEIVSLDIETLEKLQSIEADTEPLCTGPGGMLYFYKYNEGMAWYSMDSTGQVSKIN